jgi:hypothetical protein
MHIRGYRVCASRDSVHQDTIHQDVRYLNMSMLRTFRPIHGDHHLVISRSMASSYLHTLQLSPYLRMSSIQGSCLLLSITPHYYVLCPSVPSYMLLYATYSTHCIVCSSLLLWSYDFCLLGCMDMSNLEVSRSSDVQIPRCPDDEMSNLELSRS